MRAKDPAFAEEVRRLEEERVCRQFFVDRIPLQIIHAVVARNAWHALPLVLAAHRVMCMHACRRIRPIPGCSVVRLTMQIWQIAGLPERTDERRQTVLDHVRKIPDVMILQEKRSRSGHYLLKRGPLWRNRPEFRILNETYWEED
jgi:hypothetical protein